MIEFFGIICLLFFTSFACFAMVYLDIVIYKEIKAEYYGLKHPKYYVINVEQKEDLINIFERIKNEYNSINRND